MTTSDSADRINLFHFMQLHPDWSQEHLAQAVGRSKRWVYKWQTRLENVSAGDDAALHQIAQGQSRARKHPHALTRASKPSSSLCVTNRQKGSGAPLAPKRFCTPSPDKSPSGKVRCSCLPRHAPALRSSNATSALLIVPPVPLSPTCPVQRLCHAGKSISKMSARSWMTPRSQRAKSSMEQKRSTSLMKALRSCCGVKSAPISRPKRCWRRWLRLLRPTDFPSASPWMAIRAPWVRQPEAIFPRLCCALEGRWASRCRCAPRTIGRANGFVERYHRTSQEECLSLERPRSVEQARIATEAFVKHSKKERPNQARSCENRPPLTAFPTEPPLPRPPLQVEVDGWRKRGGWLPCGAQS
jgi:hypothetical protein